MYSVTRRIECDIGHRIPDHTSKCSNIHGHRYVVEATCVSRTLISQGSSKDMVLDFSFLKDEMMKVIHAPADHALILSIDDPLRDVLMQQGSGDLITCEGDRLAITDFGKIYTIDASPTAEALAQHWFVRLENRVIARSEGHASLQNIRVYETPNCWAVYPAET